MDYLNNAREYRKELHKIPEAGLKEYKTSAYIKGKLAEMGYEYESVLETGVVAIKKGIEIDCSIAFRADMDGLPISEETNCIYKSENEGMMHGCGHDFHMSILLGLADYLKDKETKSNIVFIFQPAEESPGGAKPIIDLGILHKYKVKEIYGLHVWPYLSQGIIGVKSGPIMAMTGEFEIEVKGIGGHGAIPNEAIDPIYISSQLLSSLQSIISRNVEPVEHGVVTIGYIKGGAKHNIIPDKVEMGGTIRAFNQETYDKIKNRIRILSQGIAEAFETEIIVRINDFYKAVNNDEKLTEEFESALNGNVVKVKPSMTGEDFSFYQQAVPGVFFFLGSINEDKGYVHPLHNSKFDADEKIVEIGLETYIKLLKHKKLI